MIEKPKIGEPCNGCGICCMNQVCMNGSYVLKLVRNLGEYAPGPCPAIVRRHDGTIACGIVLNPNKYIKKSEYPAKVLSKYFAFLIGSGSGCDEILTGDTPEENLKLDEMIEKMRNDAGSIEKAKTAVRIIHGI
jgi:hypothetical protein